MRCVYFLTSFYFDTHNYNPAHAMRFRDHLICVIVRAKEVCQRILVNKQHYESNIRLQNNIPKTIWDDCKQCVLENWKYMPAWIYYNCETWWRQKHAVGILFLLIRVEWLMDESWIQGNTQIDRKHSNICTIFFNISVWNYNMDVFLSFQAPKQRARPRRQKHSPV